MGDWTSHLRPGMVAVDVGANVGTFTSTMQSAGVEVWAIEPDPRCHSRLRDHVPPERLIGMAVGDHTGTTMLYRSREAPHNSLYQENVLEPGSVAALEVPIATLDGLQAEGILPPRIDFIKVDAQGAELGILTGAERICQTQRPIWYVEFWPTGLTGAGTSLQALCELCERYGYQPEGNTWPNALEAIGQIEGHGSNDLLLLRD